MTLSEAKKMLGFDSEVNSRDDLFEHFEKYINKIGNDAQTGITAFVIIHNYYKNTLKWAKYDFSKVIKVCLNENDEDIRNSMKKLAEYFSKIYK